MAATKAFANWGNWRGPNHDGVSVAGLPDTWSETKCFMETPLPSAGSSTPVIIEGKIFTCEVEARFNSSVIAKQEKSYGVKKYATQEREEKEAKN